MIEVKDLFFSYKNKEVIKDINLKLNSGLVYCLLGKNGSGKTTLLRLLAGLLEPDLGYISLYGDDIRTINRKKIAEIISYVPQGHEAYFPYSVIDMVVMGRAPYLDIFSRPQKEDYQKADEVLCRLGIMGLRNRNYIELSGGEKRLVFIARALVQETDYIFLDEPTANLDFSNQKMITDILKNISRQRERGVIVSLHDPNLVSAFSDEVILMKSGKIINQGVIKEIMNENNLIKTYDIDIEMINYSEERRIFFSS